MSRQVIGGGTAGTMFVNQLRRTLASADWSITLIDRELLFI